MKRKTIKINLRITIIFLLLFVQIFAVKSQVTASLNYFNPYQINIEDFYQISVINSGSETQFDLEVTITTSGVLLYKSFVKNIEIPRGSKNFTFNGFTIKSEEFPSNKFLKSLQTYRQFTTGVYEVCYLFTTVNTKEPQGENCDEREIVSMTPILLNTPDQNATVNSTSPIFIWISPTPLPKSGINYQIKIVEMLPRQSEFEALTRNPAIYKGEYFNSLSFNYPNNAIPLQNQKSYAWQVINPDNRKIDSEIWKFTINIDTGYLEEKILMNENFIIPDEKGSLSNLNINNQIRILIPESGKVSKLDITIFDVNQKKVELNQTEFINNIGSNKFIIDLFKISELKSKNYYTIIIKTPGGKQDYKIFFRYFKS